MAGAAVPHALGPESHAPGHSSCPPSPGRRRKQVSAHQASGREGTAQGLTRSQSLYPCPHFTGPTASLLPPSLQHLPHPDLRSPPVSARPLSSLQLEALPLFAAALLAAAFLPEYVPSALTPQSTANTRVALRLLWGLAGGGGRIAHDALLPASRTGLALAPAPLPGPEERPGTAGSAYREGSVSSLSLQG